MKCMAFVHHFFFVGEWLEGLWGGWVCGVVGAGLVVGWVVWGGSTNTN